MLTSSLRRHIQLSNLLPYPGRCTAHYTCRVRLSLLPLESDRRSSRSALIESRGGHRGIYDRFAPGGRYGGVGERPCGEAVGRTDAVSLATDCHVQLLKRQQVSDRSQRESFPHRRIDVSKPWKA